MSSEIKADKWSPASGTSATIGDSGDTYTVPSGVTLNTSSATLTLPSTVITGQTAKTSLVDADKFLISDSAASGALKYVESQYIGGGAMTLLNSTTASGLSAVNYDNFSATYDVYKLIGSCSTGVNNAEVRFQVRKSGSNITSGNYRYANISAERTSSASDHSNKSNWGGNHALISNGSSYSTSHPTSFDITIYAPFDGTRQTSMTIQTAYYRPNEDTWYSFSGGVWVDGDAGDNNTGISLFASNGTIDNAKMALYGVQKS